MYFVVEDMSEITKKDFDEAKKDARKVFVNKPNYFVWSEGQKRVLHIHSGDKYYSGRLGPTQMYGDLDQIYDFMYIDIKAPKAVFRRKPHLLKPKQKPKVDVMTPSDLKEAS
jgi:hypothetical protein